MKRLYIALALLGMFVGSSMAQVKFNHFGLGFNFNGSARVPSSLTSDKLTEIQRPGAYSYGSVNRTFSAYEFGFNPTKLQALYFDVDLLQGTDYIYSSSYYDDYDGDSSFSYSSNYDAQASLLGLKAMARFTTPAEKRFFYNVGLGVEALYGYNVEESGSHYYYVNHYPSSYFYSEQESFRNANGDSYTGINLVQQVGLSFRLGKDEASFPLNRSYIETDFQIMNNFMMKGDEVHKFRTYGFTLSLVYEIQ